MHSSQACKKKTKINNIKQSTYVLDEQGNANLGMLLSTSYEQ